MCAIAELCYHQGPDCSAVITTIACLGGQREKGWFDFNPSSFCKLISLEALGLRCPLSPCRDMGSGL